MPAQVRVINPLSGTDWDDLVLSRENYSPFHSSAWARVLCDSYHFKPRYLEIAGDNQPAAVVPFMEVGVFPANRRGISLPFSDYCGPLIGQQQSAQSLLLDLILHARQCGWRYLELRAATRLLDSTPPTYSYYGHQLKLQPDIQPIFRNFRKSIQRTIKKATHDNIKVTLDTSDESLKEFYRLHCMTRKMHGVPPQPWSFFRKLHSHFLRTHQGSIFLASYRGRYIAGALCFHFGTIATYKYAASDRKYKSLGASSLIVWEIIRYYAKSGFTALDFGRTDPANTGLMHFKNGWGGSIRTISYYKYDLKEAAFMTGTNRYQHYGEVLFKRCPIFFLKTVGSLIYRYMA